MSFLCGQCGADCRSEEGLRVHLKSFHGLNVNPVPHTLPNLWEVVERLQSRVDVLEEWAENEVRAIDERLEELEEPEGEDADGSD